MSKPLDIILFFVFIIPLFHFIAYRLHFFQRNKESNLSIRFPLIGAICYLILVYFLSPFLLFLLNTYPTFLPSFMQNHPERLIGLLQILFAIFTSFFVVIFFFLQPKATFQGIWSTSFSALAILKDMGFGFLTYLLSFPLVAFVYEITQNLIIFFFHIPPKEQFVAHLFSLLKNASILFVITLIFITLIIPILEEIIFRGFLQTYLKSRLGFKKAWIGSSFLFASFHYHPSQGITNIPLIAALFTLSLYLGFIYEKRRSLFSPIALHMTFNSISVIRIVLSLSSGK